MPVFKIQHVTKYTYDRPVQESVNEIRVFSYHSKEQEVLQHDLYITGTPDVFTFTDYWGNKAGTFSVLPPHNELVIESRLTVRTTAGESPALNFNAGFDLLHADVAGRLKMIELAAPDVVEKTAALRFIVDELRSEKKSVATVIQDCCAYIFNSFQYIKGITNVETTVDEILDKQAGVCQDFAHVMLQVLRSMGIPSRYVSGYICPNKNGLRGEGATHAWVEAWIPGQGWTGSDPTNNVWVTDDHVKLAAGRNFNDCSPVKGTFKGPAVQKLSVFVSVGYEDGAVFEGVSDVPVYSTASLKAMNEMMAQQ
jgi:transglutaminase-like putative cysteine protease